MKGINHNFIKFCFISLICFFSACGGGGESGSSTVDHSLFSINNQGSDYATSGVRFIFASLDEMPLQIRANETVLTAAPLRYGFSNFISLSNRDYTLEKYLTNEPVTTFKVNFGESKRATALLCGSRENDNIAFNIVKNNQRENKAVQIRGVHAVFGAEKLLFVMNEDILEVPFCNASSYVTSKTGDVAISVYRLADNKLIYNQLFEGTLGRSYSLIFRGDLQFDYSAILVED